VKKKLIALLMVLAVFPLALPAQATTTPWGYDVTMIPGPDCSWDSLGIKVTLYTRVVGGGDVNGQVAVSVKNTVGQVTTKYFSGDMGSGAAYKVWPNWFPASNYQDIWSAWTVRYNVNNSSVQTKLIIVCE